MTSVEQANFNCEFCGSDNIIQTPPPVTLSCTDCGTVKDKIFVDPLPVKRNNKGSLVSQHNTFHDYDLPTTFNENDVYYRAYRPSLDQTKQYSSLNYRRKSRFRQLKFIQRQIVNTGYSTEKRTYHLLMRMKNYLPDVPRNLFKTSFYQYRKLRRNGLKEESTLAVITLFLLNCKKERLPYSFREIISAAAEIGMRVTPGNVTRFILDHDLGKKKVISKPGDYFSRYASEIIQNKEVVKRVSDYYNISINVFEMLLINIAEQFYYIMVEKLNYRTSENPRILSITLLYLADRVIARSLVSKTALTQNLIANACDSAEYTIRDHIYRSIGDYYEQAEKDLIKFCWSLLPEINEVK